MLGKTDIENAAPTLVIVAAAQAADPHPAWRYQPACIRRWSPDGGRPCCPNYLWKSLMNMKLDRCISFTATGRMSWKQYRRRRNEKPKAAKRDSPTWKWLAIRETAGWGETHWECCQSYPIPLVLTLYRSGNIIRRIRQGQMLWAWSFRDGGRKVATVWGRHGPEVGDYQPL